MRVRFLAIGCAALVIAGCGGTNLGTVTGKVMLQGEPIPSGTVAFQGAKGWVGTSNINSGEYKISEVPVGEVKITVQTFPPSPSVVPPDTPASSVKLPSLKYVEIPKKYSDFNSSPLRYQAKPGAQQFDVTLEAK